MFCRRTATVFLLCAGFLPAVGSAQSTGSVRSEKAVVPAYVLVDRTDPAFVLFQGIPEDMRAEATKQMQSQAASGKASLIPWEQFRAGAKDYARTAMIRNDYPTYDVAAGIVCLVGAVSGVPWSITWNGGIAFTRNDYEWAKRQFKAYSQDPAKYRPVRDRRADPINPGAFLPAFGCL